MKVKLDLEKEIIEAEYEGDVWLLTENEARELASKVSQCLADLEEYNIRNRLDDC